MGHDYSKIQGSVFPSTCFVLGFRQPDIVQLLHVKPETVTAIRQAIVMYWSAGIKTEKKYPLGIEIRLAQEPFGSDINNLERIVSTYKLCNHLLHILLNDGYELITSGHLLRGIERSAWIFRIPNDIKTTDNEIVTVGIEDWGRVIIINSFDVINTRILQSVKEIWPKGVESGISDPTVFSFNLVDQPWDSYKSASEKTPYIILELFKIFSDFGYSYLTSTHIRGNMDALTFRKTECASCQNLSVLSLNQRDQVRLYSASADVVRATCKMARETWEHGVIKEEQWGAISVTQLKGSPWFIPDWDKDSITNAREFVTNLIREIHQHGWTVIAKADIYRSAYDKSLVVLEECPSATLSYLSISTNDVDRLCVTGASLALKTAIIDEVKNSWSRGHKEEFLESTNGSWTVEFSLEGKPWQWDMDSPQINLEGIGLICTILEFMRLSGWKLVTGIEISSSTKFTPATWIFSQENPDNDKHSNHNTNESFNA